MMKTRDLKILLVILIAFLFSSSIQTLGLSINKKDFIERNESLPDFIITELIFWYNPDIEATYIHGSVKNIGEDVVSENIIIVDIAIFLDEEKEPIFSQCPALPLYSDRTWIENGSDVFLAQTVKNKIPKKVKAVVDYNNKVMEENENNNEKTEIEISPIVTVFGTVYMKDDKGTNHVGERDATIGYGVLEVVKSPSVVKGTGIHNYTDKYGRYRLLIPAKKPFDKSFVYTVECHLEIPNSVPQSKNTDYLKPGDSYELNFLFIKKPRLRIYTTLHELIGRFFSKDILLSKSKLKTFLI